MRKSINNKRENYAYARVAKPNRQYMHRYNKYIYSVCVWKSAKLLGKAVILSRRSNKNINARRADRTGHSESRLPLPLLGFFSTYLYPLTLGIEGYVQPKMYVKSMADRTKYIRVNS